MALLIARSERCGLPLYAESERMSWTELDTYTQPAHRVEWVCQQRVLDPASLTDPKCEFGSGESPARILLLGDSHAAEFAPVFRVAAEAQHLRVRSVPVRRWQDRYRAWWPASVSRHASRVRQILERARDFPLLILGAAWANFARNDPGVWARLESQLRELVAQGHRVWLLPRVLEFADFDAACPVKRVRVGDWLRCQLRWCLSMPAAIQMRALRQSLNAYRACDSYRSTNHYVPLVPPARSPMRRGITCRPTRAT